MAYVKEKWHAEPWIKTVSKEQFVAWYTTNGKGSAEEAAELYDNINPATKAPEKPKA